MFENVQNSFDKTVGRIKHFLDNRGNWEWIENTWNKKTKDELSNRLNYKFVFYALSLKGKINQVKWFQMSTLV